MAAKAAFACVAQEEEAEKARLEAEASAAFTTRKTSLSSFFSLSSFVALVMSICVPLLRLPGACPYFTSGMGRFSASGLSLGCFFCFRAESGMCGGAGATKVCTRQEFLGWRRVLASVLCFFFLWQALLRRRRRATKGAGDDCAKLTSSNIGVTHKLQVATCVSFKSDASSRQVSAFATTAPESRTDRAAVA